MHISVTNPGESELPYFRAKLLSEKAVMDSGLSYANVRPTLTFGEGDILTNNFAWLLRHFPIFPVQGLGDYRVQPVFVEDVAKIAVGAGLKAEDIIIDAKVHEIYTFEELARLVAKKVRSRARIIHLRPSLALFLCRLAEYVVNDIILTREGLKAVMANLLVTEGPPTGKRCLSDWLEKNSERVGVEYASELDRHFR